MTKSTGVGRGRKGIPRHPYSVKNGMKLCRGPSHPPGGEWLPATTKYFYVRKEGAVGFQLYTGCKRCRHWRQNKHTKVNTGWVEVREIHSFLMELVNRLGKRETAKRLRIGYHRFNRIYNGKQKHVQKRTAARMMELHLVVVRANEFRDTTQLRTARRKMQNRTNFVEAQVEKYGHG